MTRKIPPSQRKISPKCEEGTIRSTKKASGRIEYYKKIDGKWVYQKKDRTKKLVYGIGINDVMISGFSTSKIGTRWYNIIKRTDRRDPNIYSFETYKDCTLDPRWFKLSAFKEWSEQWDDYENKEIDKDILIPGNKIYGPETCLMVRKSVNLFFKPNIKRDLPRGVHHVSKFKEGGKNPYSASIVRCGEKKKTQSTQGPANSKTNKFGRIHLGHYPTIEEASVAYESARKEQIQFLIETETDIRVKNALIKQQG